jgi:NIMA (never in mitosis gene a)-related kinase
MGSLANYDVGSVLGSGQFSVVYQAKDRRSGARVAMKKLQIFDIMSSSVRQECLREARLLESLDHPCVISVVESFMEDNDLYIALELGEHGNLQELLGTVKQQQKLLLEPLVWQYFVQISSAVEHMHSRRIMHRDIKPANIFVMADGRCFPFVLHVFVNISRITVVHALFQVKAWRPGSRSTFLFEDQ